MQHQQCHKKQFKSWNMQDWSAGEHLVLVWSAGEYLGVSMISR